MRTLSHLYKTQDDLQAFLETCLNPTDEQTNQPNWLVQIFTNNREVKSFSALTDLIRTYFQKAVILGATVDHCIQNGQIISGGILIVVTAFKSAQITPYYFHYQQESAYRFGKNFASQLDFKDTKLLYAISSMSPTQTAYVYNGILSDEPTLTLTGAVIDTQPRDFLYCDGHFVETGAIGFTLHSDDFYVHTHTASSIISIGREHVITTSHDRIIEEIDNIPAMAFYESYLGTSIHESLPNVGELFPLLVHRGKKIYPNPVMCHAVDGTLATLVPVNQGDVISLGYSDLVTFFRYMSQFVNNLHSQPVETIFCFGSYKRALELTSQVESYVIPLHINGFLSFGDLEYRNAEVRIVQEMMTATVLSEHKYAFIETHEKVTYTLKDNLSREKVALVQLIEKTARELAFLNQSLENMVIEKTNELVDHHYMDQLTKLPNLNKLSEDIYNEDIKGLALFDISAFIDINNFYGAQIGNNVLIELASQIQEFNEKYQAKTYRVHADIFAIATLDNRYKLFCNRMRILQTKIHKHCFISANHKIYINTTVAIGSPTHHLYENTNMTLQHAKSKKTAFMVYDESLKIEDSIQSNLTWTLKIRNAIKTDQIVPFFQPIYNNSTSQIDRFEVLMRLIDDDGTVISPFQFLEIAKKANLYKSLTKIIIRKAFEYFEHTDFKFSINLSSQDITDQAMRSFIFNKLASCSKPQNVIFEIVESESIENYEVVIEFINEIKSYGAMIAIDDFGTGFSNFHYLFKLNVDCIKIDGSIIQKINTDNAAALVAETIVDFARKMGISTVAEYVSDEEIFTKTHELGIDFAQGFFVAQPHHNLSMPNG